MLDVFKLVISSPLVVFLCWFLVNHVKPVVVFSFGCSLMCLRVAMCVLSLGFLWTVSQEPMWGIKENPRESFEKTDVIHKDKFDYPTTALQSNFQFRWIFNKKMHLNR